MEIHDQTVFNLPTEARWQDLERIGRIVVPVILLLFVAIYFIVLTFFNLHANLWYVQANTFTEQLWLIARIIFAVLLPLIAAILGIRLIFTAAKKLMVALYNPDETSAELQKLLRRKLMGVPPVPPPLNLMIKYPFIVLEKPEDLDKKYKWTRWFGGPAVLVIYDGIALYIEKGNRFSRVVGPSIPMPYLERDERVKEVINLKPQTKTGIIMPWTKDGIRIKLEIKVECQIKAGQGTVPLPPNYLYPFDPQAVKTVVERMTVRRDAETRKLLENPWFESAWGTITGYINAYVARRTLDELFVNPNIYNEENTVFSDRTRPEPHKIEQIFSLRITQQSLNEINDRLAPNGIRANYVQVTKVELDDEISELRIQYWESNQKWISALKDSQAEANRIRLREKARADTQNTMLKTIIARLEGVDPATLTEHLALSLSSTIDQGLDDPMIRSLLAKESFALLERIRILLNQRF